MRLSRPFDFLAPDFGFRRQAALAASAMFLLGVLAGAALRPTGMPPRSTPIRSAPIRPALAAADQNTVGPTVPLARRLDSQLSYPAEVVRIIDGDTFEARVRVWPGLDVDTKVRLRGIDAAELHARCADEYAKAEAARIALEKILSEGGVTLSQVGIDKYGGRIDATIATSSTPDVSSAMRDGGWARSYDGGRRGTWCG